MYDTLPSRPQIDALVNPARLYLGPEQYRRLSRHPYASPLFAKSYDNLPPILIQSGGSETMTDEVRSFADKFVECKYTMSKHEEYEVCKLNNTRDIYIYDHHIFIGYDS